MMKFSIKHVAIGSLLFAAMGVSANQAAPVMTMDTLQGLSNLKKNMRGDKLRSVDFNSNNRRSADTFQYMRFRGIDLSDRPLITENKQTQSKATSAAKKTQQTKSADSED